VAGSAHHIAGHAFDRCLKTLCFTAGAFVQPILRRTTEQMICVHVFMKTVKKKEPERFRVHLEFPETLRPTLDELQVRTHSTTSTEVFRKALTLLNMVTEHTATGGHIVLKHKNGDQEIVRLL
jgi:hypothetical protein